MLIRLHKWCFKITVFAHDSRLDTQLSLARLLAYYFPVLLGDSDLTRGLLTSAGLAPCIACVLRSHYKEFCAVVLFVSGLGERLALFLKVLSPSLCVSLVLKSEGPLTG